MRINPNRAIPCTTEVVRQNRSGIVRRVMRPTRWRRSTHRAVGVAVLAVVAAVIAVAALLTGGRGSSARTEPARPGPRNRGSGGGSGRGYAPLPTMPSLRTDRFVRPGPQLPCCGVVPRGAATAALVPGAAFRRIARSERPRRDHRARHLHRADRDPVDRGQPGGQAIGFVLSSVAITGVVLAYLWLDRWEPEPPRLLVLAFVWAHRSPWSFRWCWGTTSNPSSAATRPSRPVSSRSRSPHR
jgi:hypothetical protein